MPRVSVGAVRARIAAVALGAAVMLSLAGCTTPQPTPTPTPAFANDEEAFAAAEATYRAYVDALNQVDLSDPETFEAVYDLTTGEANAGARKTFSQMHADGWVVSGSTGIQLVEPSAVQPDTAVTVSLDVCLDVSEVTLVDQQGDSMVAPDRRDVQSMKVTFEPSSTNANGAVIAEINGRDGEPHCGG